VVSLATLAQYQQTGKSAQEMAEELRVEYLLTSWMRKEGGIFRFHVEIVNARSFTFVWVGSIQVHDEKETRLASNVGVRIAQAAREALLPGAVISSEERPGTGATQD